MFSVSRGLICDVRIIHLLVMSSFFLHLPHLFRIQLAFSCVFQNYCQHLPGLVALSSAFIYRWSEQYSILIRIVRAEVPLFSGSVVSPTRKSNTRPFGIVGKMVGQWQAAEVWSFRLLVLTQTFPLNHISNPYFEKNIQILYVTAYLIFGNFCNK